MAWCLDKHRDNFMQLKQDSYRRMKGVQTVTPKNTFNIEVNLT